MVHSWIAQFISFLQNAFGSFVSMLSVNMFVYNFTSFNGMKCQSEKQTKKIVALFIKSFNWGFVMLNVM